MHCRPTVEAHDVVFELPDLRVPLAGIPLLATAALARPAPVASADSLGVKPRATLDYFVPRAFSVASRESRRSSPPASPPCIDAGRFARAFVPVKHPLHAYRSQVAITIEATFAHPRSHYREAGVKPTAPPLPRPDCDNLAKAVLDGLQQVISDDTRVARLAIQKAWGSGGSTTVTIAPGVDGEGATS